ncbi:hypothetical protein BDV96DRAFT_376751 [Lophiotrema nucula]|uniref:Uncharacterized protein n=1 Tax=Lophiotrema nucula TaxID=690887 RepID=A0A6A5YG73_9PLEO|nr:hypothetical protein BDV96DRAFT_376751 [Lophiotrema nucula]
MCVHFGGCCCADMPSPLLRLRIYSLALEAPAPLCALTAGICAFSALQPVVMQSHSYLVCFHCRLHLVFLSAIHFFCLLVFFVFSLSYARMAVDSRKRMDRVSLLLSFR